MIYLMVNLIVKLILNILLESIKIILRVLISETVKVNIKLKGINLEEIAKSVDSIGDFSTLIKTINPKK